MNNFIFENATKVYFGKDCVKEYLSCFAKKHGEKVLKDYRIFRNYGKPDLC